MEYKRRASYTNLLWPYVSQEQKTTTNFKLTPHSDAIRTFDWRIRMQSATQEDGIPALENIQMVSWSKDQTLRMWTFDRIITIPYPSIYN